MEPLAGVVIEYLVIGSTAALWILLLLGAFDRLPKEVPDPLLILLVPLLYVLGMLSDRLGRRLIEKPKEAIEAKLHKGQSVSTQDVHSRLVVYLPALATQLESRRTRDRISRGVLANVPFLTVTAMILAGTQVHRGGAIIVLMIAVGGVLLYGAVLSMWRRYQLLSSRYEIQCDLRLGEIRQAKSEADRRVAD